MELASHEPRVIRNFDDLDQLIIPGTARNAQTGSFNRFQQHVVDFVAVTMTFGHDVAVDLVSEGAGLDGDFLTAQTHRAAEIGRFVALLHGARAVLPLGDEGDHGVRGVGLEFGRVGAAQAADVAGEFDHGHLHAETNPEERNVVHAGVFDRLDHAFGAALAETARNQDGVEAFEDAGALRSRR